MATNQALVEAIYAILSGMGALSSGFGGTSAWTMSGLGLRVNRGAAVDIAPGPTNIFTIAGGRIILTGLYGIVTIIRSGGAPATMALAFSVGPTALHAPALAITGNATVGTIFDITGDPADALIVGVGTGVAETSPPIQAGMHGSATAGIQQPGLVLGAGSITVAHSAVGATGTTRYVLTYIPLDAAVTVLAV